MTPTEEFAQLRLKFTDPIQHNYEVIRPIVLFDETVSERSHLWLCQRTKVLHLCRTRDSRQRVSIWIYEGQLRIEYQETLLAQYQVGYDQRQKRLQNINQPTLYQTPFASPQLELFELDDEQWLKIYQRTYERRQKRIRRLLGRQLHLIDLEIAV